MNINSFKIQMDKLNVGMHVEIMRSNGRIHGAIVTELKPTTKSVSVEWFEKGETKGKEIDISALIKSNPLIFQSDPAIDVVVAAHPDVHTSRSRHTISSVDTATNNNSKGAKPNIQQLTNAPKKAGSAKQEEKTNNKRNVQTTGNRKTSHEPAAKSNRQKVADKRLTSVVENHLGEEVLDTLEPANNDQKMMEQQVDLQSQHLSIIPQVNEMDKVSIGMHINIERSDGRIHGAMVTQVNRDTQIVSVEWFEMGETKGKDLDFKVIMRNNPDFFQPLMPQLSTPTNKNSLCDIQTTRSRHSIVTTQSHHLHNPQAPHQSTRQAPAMMKTPDFLVDFPDESLSRRKTHGLAKPTSSAMPSTVNGNDFAVQKLTDINEDFLLGGNLSPEFPISNDIKENEPLVEPSQLQSNARKSQLLSNIEELERNREKRRLQQGQARKQRQIQMQIDPGNPNWEFLTMIRDYQAQLVYRPLRITDSVVDNRICVCVRKRPLSKKEMVNKEVEVVTIPSKDHVIVHQPQVKVDLTKYLVNQKFRFDYTFNENTDNELVYRFSAQPLVTTIFQRGFATCFAYGQTGSGKTHTMGGIIEGRRQDCSNGIYAMTATDVFALLHSAEYRNVGLSVSCSFFEIYGSKVYDLLARKAVLRVLEDGKHLVQVVGLKEVHVQNVEDVLKLIKIGSDQRTAGQTSANSNSSRSHAVFQIILRKREKSSELYGKFSLIDLAGNERGADTISSDRQTRLEGAEINKSLLALKECIRAMGREEQHIPFRGSKLTLILRDSFVGRNAKTCMIAMISPGISSVENTMNTLRYADRVKELGSDRDEQIIEEEEDGEMDEFFGNGHE